MAWNSQTKRTFTLNIVKKPVILHLMSSSQTDKILGLPRRPKMAEASSKTLVDALALGLLTRDLFVSFADKSVDAGLANQRLPLELAVREYLKTQGFEVVFFYRSPRSVKISFRYADSAFWTIEAVIPDDLHIDNDDRDDWLYSNLIYKELPQIIKVLKLKQSLNKLKNESR